LTIPIKDSFGYNGRGTPAGGIGQSD